MSVLKLMFERSKMGRNYAGARPDPHKQKQKPNPPPLCLPLKSFPASPEFCYLTASPGLETSSQARDLQHWAAQPADASAPHLQYRAPLRGEEAPQALRPTSHCMQSRIPLLDSQSSSSLTENLR